MKNNKYCLGKKHSLKTKLKMSLVKKGNKCYLWKGGITTNTIKRISTMEWRYTKKRIKERDKYTCQKCKKTNCQLHIHHIIPYRISKNDSDNNLIALCQSCHKKEDNKYSFAELREEK